MCVTIHTYIPSQNIYCSPSRGIIEDTTVYRKWSVYIFPLKCLLPKRDSAPRPPTRPTPLFIFLSIGEKILEADSQLRPLLSKFIGRLGKARNAVTQKKLQVVKPLGGSTARKGGKKKSRERVEDEEWGEEEEGEEEQEKDKEQEEGGGGQKQGQRQGLGRSVHQVLALGRMQVIIMVEPLFRRCQARAVYIDQHFRGYFAQLN